MQGLSLSIPAGTSCALVGTSGSGKSTVLRLLFRFYEPDSGTLSVAGRSITDYTMKSLRAKIGEVGPRIQQSFLRAAFAFMYAMCVEGTSSCQP